MVRFVLTLCETFARDWGWEAYVGERERRSKRDMWRAVVLS